MDPALNICHVYHPSQLDPINTTKCHVPSRVQISFVQDLRPIFHWNTKQLFLYLSAEYNNTQGVCRLSHVSISVRPARSCALPIAPAHQETNPAFHFQITNEVVIWDRIVRSKENAIIHIDNASNKYAFREISKSFRCAEYFNLSPTFLEIGSLVAQSWWTRALVIIQIRVLAQSLSASFTGMRQTSNLYSSTM